MDDSGTEITRKMKEVVSGVMGRINTLYCREDFERKIKEVMKQNKPLRSGYPNRKIELNDMSAACGVNTDMLLNPKTRSVELAKIPERDALSKQLITELHNIYMEFPTAMRFMERLVRKRLKGAYKEDSVRLAILKKFIQETDYHAESVYKLILNKSVNKKEYCKLNEKGKRKYIINHLDESIFDNLTRGTRELDVAEWGRFLIQRIEKDEAKKFALSTETLSKLTGIADCIADTRTTGIKDLEALHIITDAAENNLTTISEYDETINEVLNLVENEFCAYLKQFEHISEKGKKSTKDEAFRQAKKDCKKKNKADWKLLQLADDLATGKFRVNGYTKEQLYIFAIVFDMTVFFGDENEAYDKDRDIEKNLFHDYYNDNLLRYIFDDEYKGHKTYYEAEPSGEGINYKNYVEIIYLYYLYKNKPKLNPGKKIEKAQAMIEQCTNKAKNYGNSIASDSSKRTAYYKRSFEEALMTIKNENALVEYLCNNYDIYDPDAGNTRILIASEQNTAKEKYAEIVKEIRVEFRGDTSESKKYKNEEFDYGINADELFAELREQFYDDTNFINNVLGDNDFYELMQKLNEKLHVKKKVLLSATKNNNKKSKISRTDIIALYYGSFRYVLDKLIKGPGVVDLPGLYDEFCDGDGKRKGINAYLEECRFQKISEKNIFDMFVLFSLFLEQIQ